MYKGLAVALLCAAVVSPAFGHGTQWNYNFTIDSTQSSLTLAFQGSPKYTWGVSPLSGSYTLNTNPVGGGEVPARWWKPLTAESITATTTTTLQFGFGAQQGTIQPGYANFDDFDRYDDDGPVTPAGYPIATTSALDTDVHINILGTMPALITPGNPMGYFPLNEWLSESAIDWTFAVADDNYIGATVAGAVESKVTMYGVYPVPAGGTTTYLDVYLTLVGAAPIPEPATGALLLLAGLPLLRRRRA